jgi:eukaryotic-like serine/threonine-protein kinase
VGSPIGGVGSLPSGAQANPHDRRRRPFVVDRVEPPVAQQFKVDSVGSREWRGVLRVGRGCRREQHGGGSSAQYAAGGLVFLRGTTLLAQPFDISRRQLSGQPVVLAELIQANLLGVRGGAFSVSQAGGLVYQPAAAYGFEYGVRLVWSTRSGQQTALEDQPSVYRDVSLAPDGMRAALSPLDEHGRSDLWLLNVARGLRTRLTFDGNAQAAVWSPDAREVIFSARRGRTVDLYRKRAEGGGDEQLVFSDDREKTPVSWSPDGRAVLYQTVDEIWMLALDGSREPRKLVDTPFSEQWPQFSPDGRWIAYTSDESGRREVYVTRAEGTGRWQISHSGGSLPRWSRKSPELFFHSADNQIVAAHLDATGMPSRSRR